MGTPTGPTLYCDDKTRSSPAHVFADATSIARRAIEVRSYERSDWTIYAGAEELSRRRVDCVAPSDVIQLLGSGRSPGGPDRCQRVIDDRIYGLSKGPLSAHFGLARITGEGASSCHILRMASCALWQRQNETEDRGGEHGRGVVAAEREAAEGMWFVE